MDILLRGLGTGSLMVALGALVFLAADPAPTAPPTRAERNETAINAAVEGGIATVSPERSDVYYQAILDRPVFELTRRPIDPEAEIPEPEPTPVVVVEAPEPAPELPNVSLLGVMSTGSRIQALISVDGGELIWLSEGESIGGWTITGAGEDWLELAAENNKVRLELFE